MRWLRRTQPWGFLLVTCMTAGCPREPYQSIGKVPTPAPSAPLVEVQAEKTALGTLTRAANISAFFEPGKLVNDGVGIFALDGLDEGVLPRRWGRSYPKVVQTAASIIDQMSVSFYLDVHQVLTADATYSVTRTARFIEDFAWQHQLVTKSFQEHAQRLATFKKVENAWTLDSLAPMTLNVSDSALSIQQVRLDLGSRVLIVEPGTLLSEDQTPNVTPGQAARVEVRARYGGTDLASPSLYLFLSLPPGRDRVRLQDDGHGTYFATFLFPASMKPGHLVIDAMASSTFTDLSANSYDSAVCGLSYRVQGGAK